MHIIEQLNDSHILQLHQLYQQQWWSNTRTLEEAHQVVLGSSLVLGVVDDANNLIAFTRVLTDGIFKALVFDVIVDEKYRSQQLGSRLMAAVKNHSRLQQVKHIELYCLPELQTYYQQFGFGTDVGGMQLMRLTMR
ncbi:GNAT family N-acetyltransferase [Cellvibrio sp. pealriver]|uniref:GNAT family N-acetyltransferase n=1 Tax=Cellvibrio sp. pealriver TaxID=1622269 RepID=UPI00066FE559|nr:GNAT family N-acetyltransferase [Cellvibrio sp. pealriver]